MLCERTAGDVVMPGDVINHLEISDITGKTIFGPGLKWDACCDPGSQEISDGQLARVIRPGILRFKTPNIYWVDSFAKRYIPVKGDQVIGVVVKKAGDFFNLDIGANEYAQLSYLAFESATKKNRPDVKVGDIVYGKLLLASKDCEPEMVCIDGIGRSNGMGVIRDGGFMFKVSQNLVRKILDKDCPLMKAIGKRYPSECAIGMNGCIWVRSQSVDKTIAIVELITRSEYLSYDEIIKLINR